MPRGFDWISGLSCSSLTLRLPSKATRLMTGFSTTVTISRPPGSSDADVLEQAGGVERLQALVDLEGVEPAARSGPEIGADGLGLDPLVALHDDRADALRLRIGSARRERHDTPHPTQSPEDEASDAKPSNHATHQSHSPRALCRPHWAPRRIGHPRERSSLSPAPSFKPAVFCTAFSCRVNQVLPPLSPL